MLGNVSRTIAVGTIFRTHRTEDTMLGGIPTASSVGMTVGMREPIYRRIKALPEGAIFRAVDIVGDDAALQDDFQSLRGHDYVHLADGMLTGVIETRYLRRLPRLSILISSYAAFRGVSVCETGDRVGWHLGLRPFEPPTEPRYYTSGSAETLAFGHAKIRMIPAPAWLRDESPEGRLLRVFHDTTDKDLPLTVSRGLTVAGISPDDLHGVAALARSTAIDASHTGFKPPCELATAIETALESHLEEADRKEGKAPDSRAGSSRRIRSEQELPHRG